MEIIGISLKTRPRIKIGNVVRLSQVKLRIISKPWCQLSCFARVNAGVIRARAIMKTLYLIMIKMTRKIKMMMVPIRKVE